MELKQILVRFGELSLKGKNKINFVRILANNIQNILRISADEMIIKIDRIFLNYSKTNLENLKYVFGISSYSIVYRSLTNLEKIKTTLIFLIEKNARKSFKISASRNWKQFQYNSLELNNILGDFVLKNSNYFVDVKNPDLEFGIEIRKDYSYIFASKIKGLGGMPVGSAGKIIHLISGGIDSPVAAFLMMKRGIKIDYLSFLTPPHTDQKTVDKVNRIINLLNKYQGKSLCYSFNYSTLMNYISLVSKQNYKITLMRRSFYRIATLLAKKYGYQGISNGENIGQVASQTLESINVIQDQSDFVIYRPLLCYDKNEIIQIAKKIGTYDISIEPAVEACELFAPKHPITKPTIKNAILLENELEKIKELELNSLDNCIKYLKYKN